MIGRLPKGIVTAFYTLVCAFGLYASMTCAPRRPELEVFCSFILGSVYIIGLWWTWRIK